MPAELARRELLACCSSERWAAQVASGRPYASAGELLGSSDAAVAGLAPADLEQALAGHPRIGERRAADARSRREQAGVLGADPATIQALAEGNEEYERRFGHIYLVCAAGRDAEELLALLRERLGNDPATEWGVVRSELGKINRIRLAGLLEGGHERRAAGAQMSTVTTHVLDTARGEPAAGVAVRLESVSGAGSEEIGRASTDADGRVRDIGPDRLPPGTYRLVFAVAAYFARQPTAGFFPEVAVTFTVGGEGRHYHVPLLLSPFGYATYRGS